MRITDVTIDLVDVPAPPKFEWRRGLPGSEGPTVAGVLRVHTDEGIVGEAHTPRGVIVRDLVQRRIRTELIGVIDSRNATVDRSPSPNAAATSGFTAQLVSGLLCACNRFCSGGTEYAAVLPDAATTDTQF